MNIKGKTAIITGGMSGLGRAVAALFIDKGINVALFDRNQSDAEAAILALSNDKAEVLFCHVNVCDSGSVKSAIESVVNRFGAFEIVINCAGIAPAKKLISRDKKAMALDDFGQAININLMGSFNVARLAAEYMAGNSPTVDGERGIIINTASVAAYDGQMGQCAYAASKGGIVALTLPMARDLATYGIRVNSIAPGIMGTPMLLAMPDHVQEKLVANIQFPKRMGLPKEFAELALHLVMNSYLNGETIRLDAAIRMPAS